MNKLVLLVGPSGAGKSTIENFFFRSDYQRLVSCTTRPRRKGEVDGVDYHFMSEQEFDVAWRSGELLERNMFNGHYYGMAVNSVDAALRDGNAMAVVDINGVLSVVKALEDVDVRVVFIDASVSALVDRIGRRGAGDEFRRILGAVWAKFVWPLRLRLNSVKFFKVDTTSVDAMAATASIIKTLEKDHDADKEETTYPPTTGT